MTTSTRAQIVTFRLGEDLFAADINEVERVLRYSQPTPVPNVPEWVQGVVEYRSRVVPVIDLRTRFGLTARKPDGATRLMVLTAETEWIAAVVDAVLEVVPISAAQLAPPPPLFRGLSAEFLRGILRRDEQLVIVLDVARLLSVSERLAFDRTQGILPAEPAILTQPDSPDEALLRTPVEAGVVEPAPQAGGDALIITRSGDPLLSEPLEPPHTSDVPSEPRQPEPTAPEGSSTEPGGADGEFRRADG
jgi:purine-binding chemotaxis protein CheW